MANPTFSNTTAVPFTLSVTIPNGTDVSDSVDLKGLKLLGIIAPTGFTDALHIQTSFDDSNYYNVAADSGTAYAVTTAANTLSVLSYTYQMNYRYIRLVDTTGSVTGDQTLQLMVVGE